MIRVGHGSGEQHETLCGGGGTRVTPPIIGHHRRRRRVGPHPPSPRRFFPNDCIGAVAPWYIYTYTDSRYTVYDGYGVGKGGVCAKRDASESENVIAVCLRGYNALTPVLVLVKYIYLVPLDTLS